MELIIPQTDGLAQGDQSFKSCFSPASAPLGIALLIIIVAGYYPLGVWVVPLFVMGAILSVATSTTFSAAPSREAELSHY